MTGANLKWRTISSLSLAHAVNDMCQNFLPQFIPFVIATRGFSVAASVNLVAGFTISSSLLQPLFGYLIDQKDQRWFVFVGTLWMTVLLGVTGLVPSSYPLLLAIAVLAGMGTAAFHPQAAAMVGQVSGEQKGFLLAAFISMGNAGMAISPLILLPLFGRYGLGSTWVIILPGILASILLFWLAPRPERRQGPKQDLGQALVAFRQVSGELIKLMLVVAVRALVHNGLMSLLPLFLLAKQYSPETAGQLMFYTIFIGSAGGLLGGYISDHYGRKILVVGSLLLAAAVFYGFLLTNGLLSYIFLSLGVMALVSSFSVTVAYAQELIPDNKALASGLSLGFAIGMGGLAVSAVGKFADAYGIEAALRLVLALPVLGGLVGLTLKKDSLLAGRSASLGR